MRLDTEQQHQMIVWAAAIAVLLGGLPWASSALFPYGDDNSAHFAAAMHIAEVLKAGESNLWWHSSNMGIPLFAAYQPLPTLAMGSIIAVFGGLIAPIKLFKASILICWALIPAAWYRGARWMGIPSLLCMFIALLTLSVHDPNAYGFGIRSATHKGLYTQHFGLLFLPLFVGAFAQLLRGQKQRLWSTSALFSLATMSHLWVGLYAAICAAMLVLSQPKKSLGRWRDVSTAATISTITLAWWLLPLIATNHYAGGLPWMQELHHGWPWQKTLERLLEGSIFDSTRPPILTALAGIGLVVIGRNWRVQMCRFYLLLLCTTGLLFSGRTNIGELYNWLPLHNQVNVMRYITGIHICGIFAAATALWWLCRQIERRSKRWCSLALWMLAVTLVLGNAGDIKSTLRGFNAEQSSFNEVVEYLDSQPDHRIAVHKSLGTNSHFYRDLLPLLTNRGQLQSYALGFHTTLSTYYAEYFDFSGTACELYNIGSVITRKPFDSSFPSSSFHSWQGEKHTIFHPQKPSGLFSLVEVQGEFIGPDFRALRPIVRSFAVPLFARGISPRIAVDDQETLRVVDPQKTAHAFTLDTRKSLLQRFDPAAETQAQLSSFKQELAAYSITAEVPKNQHPWLLLKVNMFPWWHAYIDEIETEIIHVAPNFMAIPLGPGTQNIRFEFRNPSWQKAGALIGLFMLIFGIRELWGNKKQE